MTTQYPIYLGGLASCIATLATHPLDLLKVQIQSRETSSTLSKAVIHIHKHNGVGGFYRGLSAGLLRQATYSSARFAAYDVLKVKICDKKNPSFLQLTLAAAMAGAIGGVAGNPADLVNIRMQSDLQKPKEQRRHYRHAFDGLYRVIREEGLTGLSRGLGANTLRATLMTTSQLACYDVIKLTLINSSYFNDTLSTHFCSSLLAGMVATTVCSPVDVLKTRIMGGSNTSPLILFKNLIKTEGFLAFFKGWIPSFARLGPQTILTFVVLEQLRAFWNRCYQKNIETQSS